MDNVVGIIGWPVSHSLSPQMHNQAFKKLGLTTWRYLHMPVKKTPQYLIKDAVLGLRALGFKGANVTVPHKESVLPYLDSLSDSARSIGAVNTICVDEQDRLVGYNTDGDGFINHLLEHNIEVKNMRSVVLGAGGSARAIAYALLAHGCKKVTVLNRTLSKAIELTNSFQPMFKNQIINADELRKDAMKNSLSADIIINTTSVGMTSSPNGLPWDHSVYFSKDQIVYDLIYNPATTLLLKKAKQDGANAMNGLGMLIHQGALSFTIWTGLVAPIDVMRTEVTSI